VSKIKSKPKKKVFCIVGKSGSGKTEVVKQLEGRGYKILQSYTTRKPRGFNEWGHEFCSMDTYLDFNQNKQIAAYTYFDQHHYFATKDQLYASDIYVVDPKGIEDLKRNIKDVKFVVIYLKVKSEIRKERMELRGDTEHQIAQRVANDLLKFAALRYDYQIPNMGELKKTVDIIDFIITA